MNKLLILLMIGTTIGCTSSNKYGECIGLNKNPKSELNYKYNAWNIGLAVVFSGMIFPPIIVLLEEYKCPSGIK